MKICILADRIPPEGRGGAEQVAWRSVLELAKRGHEVSIITTTARPLTEVEEKMIDGVRVFYIHSAYAERWRGWRSLYNLSPVRAVARILQKLHPDVVHAHNIHYHLSYHSLRLAKRAGARVLLTAHDVMLFNYGKLVEFIDPYNPICKKDWDYRISALQKIKRFKWRYNPFRQIVIKWYLHNVDVLLAVSEALRKALVQNGMPNSTVLHTGISIEEWVAPEEAVAAFRKKFGLEGRKVVLFGGRITAAKGGDQIIAALRETVKQVPSALLLIAGVRDAYVEQLLAQAREWGVEDNIACTGWLDGEELRAAYHASDVVVVPSVCFDSFPLTVLEAMACSKPVIATCFGGPTELVENNRTGFTLNPYDTATFAKRLIELLQDETKRIEFGSRGYVRAREMFSFEQYIGLLEVHYNKSAYV